MKDKKLISRKNKNISLIKLDPDNQSHGRYLYSFLKRRTFNISHNKMPSYNEHLQFVRENPYRKWFLISYKSDFIGSVYFLYNNGIGLDLNIENYSLVEDILDLIFKEIKPLKAINSVRTNNFHINIPPTNLKFKKIIQNNGGVLKQNTFEFEN